MTTKKLAVVALVLATAIAAVAPSGFGQDATGRLRPAAANQPGALAGLAGVRVRVQLDGVASDAAVREGALRPLVEMQLEKGGIEVLDESAAAQRYPSGAPVVFVYVAVMDAGTVAGLPSYFYSATVNLWEDVVLRRPPQQVVIGAATWRKMVTGRTSSNDPPREIYHAVLDVIDLFAAGNAEVNPRAQHVN